MILTNNYLKKIFDYTFAALVDRLINKTSKEENHIIIDDIENNRNKIFEQDEYSKCVIQPPYKCGDLKDASEIILEINELLTLDEENND